MKWFVAQPNYCKSIDVDAHVMRNKGWWNEEVIQQLSLKNNVAETFKYRKVKLDEG